MNILERRMYDLLKEMKESYNLSGIKISFEDEGLNMDQAQNICSVAYKAGVEVSIKIGGAEAKRDIRDAKVLGVQKIVAPMIESAYALKKFTDAVSRIYTEDEMNDTKFIVNVETVTGFKNLESMFDSSHSKILSGFVLGRTDFVGSLGEKKSFVNSESMFKIATSLARMCKNSDKKLFVGGNVNAESIDFFKRLDKIYLSGLETRNIIFDHGVLYHANVKDAIEKALNFESLWLQAKDKNYETMLCEDKRRIEDIQSRLIQKQKQ